MGSTFSTRIPGKYPLDHPRGWLVVLGVELMQCTVFGLINTFPVFHHLMSEDETLGNPTKSQLALVNAICGSVGIWIGWIWGYLGDQVGPRPLLILCTFLIACCTLLPPLFASSYIGLIFLYAVPLTLASGIANSPLATAVGTWFDKYLSTAIGTLAIGSGLGTVLIPVIAGAVGEATGSWRTGYLVLSSFIGFGAMASLLMKSRLPLSETRPALDEELLKTKGRPYALMSQIGTDLRGAIKLCKNRKFVLVFFSGLAVGYNYFAVIYCAVLIALDFGKVGTPYEKSEKVPLATASSLFVFFGVSQSCSALWGIFGHKLPTNHIAAFALAMSALCSLFIAQATTFLELSIGMGIAGFSTGGGWVTFPTLLVKNFQGAGNLLGLLMGLCYTSIGMGATLGPYVTTLITVNPSLGNESYQLGLSISALICIIGAAACGLGLPEPVKQLEEAVLAAAASPIGEENRGEGSSLLLGGDDGELGCGSALSNNSISGNPYARVVSQRLSQRMSERAGGSSRNVSGREESNAHRSSSRSIEEQSTKPPVTAV